MSVYSTATHARTPRCVLPSSQLHLTADLPAANMLTRNPTGDTVRSIYMANDIVKQIVEHNDYTRMRLVTAGTKVTLLGGDEPRVLKAVELSGASNVLFRRNSTTGAVEAVPWGGDGIELNADLHAN